MMHDAFLKVSGALFDRPVALDAFVARFKDMAITHGSTAMFHLVPGGGEPVDALRRGMEDTPSRVSRAWASLSGNVLPAGEAAHWLAIDIMNGNARMLREAFQDIENIEVPDVLKFVTNDNCDLPRSWAATSDSITYYIATRQAMKGLATWIFLLKGVDGVHAGAAPGRRGEASGPLIPAITVHEGEVSPALGSYPFDDHVTTLVARYQLPFYIVHHEHLDRVAGILAGKQGVPCTKVTPSYPAPRDVAPRPRAHAVPQDIARGSRQGRRQ